MEEGDVDIVNANVGGADGAPLLLSPEEEERRFAICTGPFTQAEKEYLVKTGQMIEKDGGFEDISTLSESGFKEDDLLDDSMKENVPPPNLTNGVAIIDSIMELEEVEINDNATGSLAVEDAEENEVEALVFADKDSKGVLIDIPVDATPVTANFEGTFIFDEADLDEIVNAATTLSNLMPAVNAVENTARGEEIQKDADSEDGENSLASLDVSKLNASFTKVPKLVPDTPGIFDESVCNPTNPSPIPLDLPQSDQSDADATFHSANDSDGEIEASILSMGITNLNATFEYEKPSEGSLEPEEKTEKRLTYTKEEDSEPVETTTIKTPNQKNNSTFNADKGSDVSKLDVSNLNQTTSEPSEKSFIQNPFSNLDVTRLNLTSGLRITPKRRNTNASTPTPANTPVRGKSREMKRENSFVIATKDSQTPDEVRKKGCDTFNVSCPSSFKTPKPFENRSYLTRSRLSQSFNKRTSNATANSSMFANDGSMLNSQDECLVGESFTSEDRDEACGFTQVVKETPAKLTPTPFKNKALMTRDLQEKYLKKSPFFSPLSQPLVSSSSRTATPVPFKTPRHVSATVTPRTLGTPLSRKSNAYAHIPAKVDSGLRRSVKPMKALESPAFLGLQSPVADYIHAKPVPSPFQRVFGHQKCVTTGKELAKKTVVPIFSKIPRPSLPMLSGSSKFNSRTTDTGISAPDEGKFKAQQYTGPKWNVLNNASFAQKHHKENYLGERHTGFRDENINASIVQSEVIPKKFVHSKLVTPRSYLR